MAGFVPGRDRATLEALAPEEAQRREVRESSERRRDLDKEELAELERAHVGMAVRSRKRSLLDQLLRRG